MLYTTRPRLPLNDSLSLCQTIISLGSLIFTFGFQRMHCLSSHVILKLSEQPRSSMFYYTTVASADASISYLNTTVLRGGTQTWGGNCKLARSKRNEWTAGMYRPHCSRRSKGELQRWRFVLFTINKRRHCMLSRTNGTGSKEPTNVRNVDDQESMEPVRRTTCDYL